MRRSTVAVAAVHSAAVLLSLAGSAQAAAVPPLPFPAAINLSSLDGNNGFVINGIDAYDRSGFSVSSAGDVNGDGYNDICIGAIRARPNAKVYAGETYVVFGGSGIGATGALDLSALNGATGFVITGIDSYDFSGFSVSGAGDVNGDGIDDLIIGAPYADASGSQDAGEAYVVFGGPLVGSSGVLSLSTLNGESGFVLSGIDARDWCGSSVSSAGDVNGDGVNDILIGAWRAELDEAADVGEAYIVFGRDVAIDGQFSSVITLSALSGTDGVLLYGVDEEDQSARRVSSAGDINGDGFDDILIGAHFADRSMPYAPLNGAGESYVVFGKNTAVNGAFPASLHLGSIDGANGFVINGIDSDDFSGGSVATAGDVNGDGIDDLIVGAWGASPNGQSNAGACYVVFGRDTTVDGPIPASFDLSTLNGTNGFIVNGIDPFDFSGWSVSSAGDVNGDGIDDVIIGARSADPNEQSDAGESYVVFGKNTIVNGPFPASINLSALNGMNGFVLTGIDEGDISGVSVSSAGDVNGDGIDDLIIGAPGGGPNGLSFAGESYVIFGRAPVPCASDVNGDGDTNAADFVILAGAFGSTVPPNAGADLNGDGVVNAADFIILAGDFGCVAE